MTESLPSHIYRLIETDGPRLVELFFTPERGVEAGLFNTYGDNNPLCITADDALALTFLEVRLSPLAFRRPVIHGEVNDVLSQIPANLDIWDAGPEHLGRESPAWHLWDMLIAIDGVGPTRASKLLARKRPRLMPVLDSVVTEHLFSAVTDQWAALHDALQDPELRKALDALRPASIPAEFHLTTLRLFDVLSWMSYSNSTSAKELRG